MTRAGIRTKIVELLTEAGNFGANVHPARVTRLASLPAACVYFDSEDVEAGRKGAEGRRRAHDAEFVVEVITRDPEESALETALDTLVAAVDTALTADNTLGGTARSCDLVRVAYDRDEPGEDETFTGAAMITFAIVYDSIEGA